MTTLGSPFLFPGLSRQRFALRVPLPVVLAITLWLLPASAEPRPAADPPASPRPPASAFVRVRSSLPGVVVRGKIRVFYATEGPHAVAPDDLNKNGTPDQPEDVATQAWAAWRLWTNLDYPDPLQSPRYRGVRWIDVHLLARDLLKHNGVAYDEIRSFERPGDDPGTLSLCFDVATSVKAPANLTPAHEMFHIVQNGITFFKNPWLTEGTARWSERGLGKGALSARPAGAAWPPPAPDMPAVYASAYDAAATYWEPLLARADPTGRIPKDKLDPELLKATYVNGDPVLKDLDLTGWELLRDIFVALGKADDDVHRDRKLDRWPEAEQKSPANNSVIHQVVQETVRPRQPPAPRP